MLVVAWFQPFQPQPEPELVHNKSELGVETWYYCGGEAADKTEWRMMSEDPKPINLLKTEYKLLGKIGSGGFSFVYLVENITSGVLRAAKGRSLSTSQSTESIDKILTPNVTSPSNKTTYCNLSVTIHLTFTHLNELHA